MARFKDIDWNIKKEDSGDPAIASLAVLMDIRDELKQINALLCSRNFTEIPHTLKEIQRNTAGKRRQA